MSSSIKAGHAMNPPSSTRSPWLTPSATPPNSRTLHDVRLSSTGAPPSKRQRLASVHPPSSDSGDFDEKRQASTKRLLDAWSQLEQRYSRPIEEDDIVDLVSLKVVKDRGNIRGLSKNWQFGRAADLDDRTGEEDKQTESSGVSEDEEDEVEEEEVDEDDLSDDELDVIPRPSKQKQSEPEATLLEEMSFHALWKASTALDPDNPSDAEDLERFLRAEERRRADCASDAEEYSSPAETESTPFSEDLFDTPGPSSPFASADSEDDPPRSSSVPLTSDAELDLTIELLGPLPTPSRSPQKKLKPLQQFLAAPQSPRKTAQKKKDANRLAASQPDDSDTPQASSSHLVPYRASSKTERQPKSRVRIPHIVFSPTGSSSRTASPHPAAGARVSSPSVAATRVPPKKYIMEVVIPAPRHQAHVPTELPRSVSPTRLVSVKGKEKASEPDCDSGSDDPLAAPMEPKSSPRAKALKRGSTPRKATTPLPPTHKRKREVFSSPEIEFIEISSDSDCDSPLPPPPINRSKSISRKPAESEAKKRELIY
jgi:hypothetical protein